MRLHDIHFCFGFVLGRRRPNRNNLIADSNGVMLEVLSKPKGCKVKNKNPWYKFWLPKYNYVGGFVYDVKICK